MVDTRIITIPTESEKGITRLCVYGEGGGGEKMNPGLGNIIKWDENYYSNTNWSNLDMNENLGYVWGHGVTVIFRGSHSSTRTCAGHGVMIIGMDIMGWDVGCGWELRGGGTCSCRMVFKRGVNNGMTEKTPIELTGRHVTIRGVRRS